jgi:ketosteroid isomerase-like protein
VASANVDVLRKSIELFNRYDIEGVIALMDPAVRFEHRMAELEGEFTGPDAVKGWFADLSEAFDSWTIECDDFRDLGDDRVLALGTVRAVGKGSGVEAEVPYTVLATFGDGLLTHFIDYGDKHAALEAARLVE